jgi:hypothetical protein
MREKRISSSIFIRKPEGRGDSGFPGIHRNYNTSGS